MNVRVLRDRSYLHSGWTICRYQSTNAHWPEPPEKTQPKGRLGEQHAQFIQQLRRSNWNTANTLDSYNKNTFKVLSSGSDSRFRGTYSPFFVPGPYNQALQSKYSNPKYFEAVKSQPGPPDRLIWHFGLMKARALPNAVYKANNKRARRIFYNAMREQGLQPDGTPITAAAPVKQEAISVEQEELKRITRFKKHGVFILAKRASSFRDGVRALPDIDPPVSTTRSEQLYTIKGTLKIRIDEKLHKAQDEILMKDARMIVWSLIKRVGQLPGSPPPVLDIRAYGPKEPKDRRILSKR